jgi:hypothetical protein
MQLDHTNLLLLCGKTNLLLLLRCWLAFGTILRLFGFWDLFTVQMVKECRVSGLEFLFAFLERLGLVAELAVFRRETALCGVSTRRTYWSSRLLAEGRWSLPWIPRSLRLSVPVLSGQIWFLLAGLLWFLRVLRCFAWLFPSSWPWISLASPYSFFVAFSSCPRPRCHLLQTRS